MHTLKTNYNFIFACLLFIGASFTANSQPVNPMPAELIIKWKSKEIANSRSTSYANLIALQGRKIKEIKGTNIEIWKLPLANEKEISTLIKEYKDHPAIAFIEPNYIYQSFEVIPNDPLFSQQWGLKNEGMVAADIAATDAWEIHKQSPNVKIAIIDSGIDWTHPDLVQNIWQNLGEDIDGDGVVLEWTGTQWIFDPDDENGIDDDGNGYVDDFIGWDFRDNDNNPLDVDGHGTHIAGIIGASGNNGLGIAGVTWEAQLVPLRIISNGRLKISDAIAAIQYATSMNIPISNNSWGGEQFSNALFETIQQATSDNHLCITAAGNDSLNTDARPIYPAAFNLDNILNVAATDTMDTNANFKVGSSNFGRNTVDIYAPGLAVISCLPNGTYGSRSGTSMAAPYVTGACALIKELFPNMPYQTLKASILSAASPIANLTDKCVSGGRLNLFNALSESGLNCAYRDSISLVDLYMATNGENWQTPWDLAMPISTWHGVTTNSDGCVIAIDLNNNNLLGTLPASIRYFSALTSLKLSNNQLSGNIPVAIGELAALTHLELNHNQLSGSIPESIGNLRQLVYLGISNNSLSGSIPDLFYIFGLKKLYLNNNQLNGILPSRIINLGPFLEELYLNNNQFSGDITYFLTGSVGSIKKLYLNSNQLAGALPLILGDQQNLQEINLANNLFTGCYPSDLSSLCSITFDFSGNINLPAGGDFGIFCTNSIGECTDCSVSDSLALVAFYLATSGPNWTTSWDLQQPFSSWHGITTNSKGCVTEINLNHNNLVGSIPASLSEIQNLESLILVDNQLTGNIPKELALINTLQIINLNYNQLSGNIPTELGQLHNLRSLSLYSNQFFGSIPVELGDLLSLDYLSIRNNQLSGTIPESLGNLINLRQLFLDNNNLTGVIPIELGQLANLIGLSLNNNLLSGNIPIELGQLANLIGLSLNNNLLNGNIPIEISAIPTLQHVDLSVNKLTGIIPPELSHITGLVTLNLGDNNLSGTIPVQLTSLKKLNFLVLSGNQLTGAIPSSFGNLNQLTFCSLLDNDLSGCFPESILLFCNSNFFSNGNPNLPNQGDITNFCLTQEGMCTAPVYPGDFNNDGIVNQADVLYWGIAKSTTGIPRPNASTDWYGQECPDWETKAIDVDNKYQDGDGNGIINETDLEVLELNYGKIHGYRPFTEVTNGTTYELATTNIRSDTIQIALNLETGRVPTNMHGIAASIDFGDLGIDSILMDFSNSALNPSHHLAIYDEENNILDIALTRTNQQDTICDGEMGVLWIIIEDAIDLDDDILIAAKNGSMIQASGALNAVGDATMLSTFSASSSATNLVSSISVSPVACDQLGMAAVTVNGGIAPYTYEWNTGATTKAITGLMEGIYRVTITDANGLTKDYTVEVEGQYIPVYDENGELVDCNPADCQPDLVLADNYANKTYQAANSIQATGIINSNDEVVFKAGNQITLQSGFTVKAGGTFHALIEDCANETEYNNENVDRFTTINTSNNDYAISLDRTAIASKQPNIFISPNPAPQNTTIAYELPIATELHLTITDLSGQFVQLLQKSRFVEAGQHQFSFDGSQLSSGVYLVRLQTTQSLVTRKLLLLK